MKKNNQKYWKELAHRYFEAETTEAEERMLKRFITSPEAQGSEWDELRAVMGYMVVGKQLHGQSVTVIRRMPQWVRIVAAAVLTGLILLPTAMRLKAPQDALDEDICIAYVDGRRVTDPSQVIQAMHRAMSHVQQVEPTATIEGQLSEMFELINK